MIIKSAIGIFAFLCIAGCQLPGSTTCNTSIDWVHFVQVGATQYVAGPEWSVVLQDRDLGPVYAKVKFKVSGNVCDPNYKLKDGDAAFLDAGTPIYQVNGQPPGLQSAARFSGQMVAYMAVAPAS